MVPALLQGFFESILPPRIDWSRVAEVTAVKEDLFGYDAISVRIQLVGGKRAILVQPETAGYEGIIGSLHQRLPGIQPGWYDDMMRDPVACFERVLYHQS